MAHSGEPTAPIRVNDLSVSGRFSHFSFLLAECFPINLFRRITIVMPEKKKSTGAKRDVYRASSCMIVRLEGFMDTYFLML